MCTGWQVAFSWHSIFAVIKIPIQTCKGAVKDQSAGPEGKTRLKFVLLQCSVHVKTASTHIGSVINWKERRRVFWILNLSRGLQELDGRSFQGATNILVRWWTWQEPVLYHMSSHMTNLSSEFELASHNKNACSWFYLGFLKSWYVVIVLLLSPGRLAIIVIEICDAPVYST